jgi:hypothetical protein
MSGIIVSAAVLMAEPVEDELLPKAAIELDEALRAALLATDAAVGAPTVEDPPLITVVPATGPEDWVPLTAPPDVLT